MFLYSFAGQGLRFSPFPGCCVSQTDSDLPYDLHLPSRQLAPLVVSSPHSGSAYPVDFLARSQLDSHAIRSSEDAFIDRLFGMAPDLGLPLLAARAPRAYLDLNRAADELDPAVIEGVARSLHNPRIASGLGVIPRVVSGGRAIYSGKLPLAEAESRIRQHWQPYHRQLRQLVDDTRLRFGEAVLIDCHSMPHEAIEMQQRGRGPLPEVVLGDRFGASAAGRVVDLVEAAFTQAGLRVTRNSPFAGAYITQHYGQPSRGIHALQIEIDRALYMDEVQIAPRPGFEDFRRRIGDILARIGAGLRGAQPLAAE